MLNGGDNYTFFLHSEVVAVGRDFGQALVDYFKSKDTVGIPAKGRLLPER